MFIFYLDILIMLMNHKWILQVWLNILDTGSHLQVSHFALHQWRPFHPLSLSSYNPAAFPGAGRAAGDGSASLRHSHPPPRRTVARQAADGAMSLSVWPEWCQPQQRRTVVNEFPERRCFCLGLASMTQIS